MLLRRLGTSLHEVPNLLLEWLERAPHDVKTYVFHTKKELFKMFNPDPTATLGRCHVSTDEFAERMLVLSQTILKSYSRNGVYCGIRPVRLPNRRLAWPADEIEKLFVASSIDEHASQVGVQKEGRIK